MAEITKLIQKWQNKNKSGDDQEIDRISLLPDNILQCILSFLPPKYATRTIVLSKQWQRLWDRLSREEQNLPAQQSPRLLKKQSIKSIYVPSDSTESALILIDGRLNVINHPEITTSLRKLILVDVLLPEENSLEEALSECHWIDEIDLCFPDGLKLGGCHWCPGLPRLPCKTLTKMYLEIPNITDDWLQAQILGKLPFLQELRLQKCHMLETLNVCSSSLECLYLVKCHRLKAIKLEAPSLQQFLYNGRNVISFLSTPVTADCRVHLYKEDRDEELKLLQLIADLAKFSRGNDFRVRVNCFTMAELFNLHIEIENISKQKYQRIPEDLRGLLLPMVSVPSFSLDVTVKQSSFRDFVAPKRNWFSCFSDCLHMIPNKDDQFMEYLRDETWRRETYRSWPSNRNTVDWSEILLC